MAAVVDHPPHDVIGFESPLGPSGDFEVPINRPRTTALH